jgi:TRAP-type C4-dicarboxylate transport system substrate-binding protein
MFVVFAFTFVLYSETVLAQAKTYEIRFAVYTPSGTHLSKAADWWATELAKRSANRVKVQVFHGQTLGKAPDSLDMLKSGVANMCLFPPATIPNRFPITELVTDTPLLRGNTRMENEVMDKLLYAGLLKEYDGYKVISWFAIDPLMLFTNKKVTNLEELKGLKIRARGQISSMIVEKLGAIPVPLEVGEFYEALDRKVINGVTTPMSAYVPLKLSEVCKYFVDEKLYGGLAVVLMNEPTWKGFPPDIQVVIEQLNKEFTYVFLDYTMPVLQKGYELAGQGGREIIRLSPEEKVRWQKALEPVVEDTTAKLAAKGLPTTEVLRISNGVLDFWKMSGLK